MSAFFCFLLFSCVGSDDLELTPRAELEYGNVLYSYYQDDFDQALLDVSVDLEHGVPDDLLTQYRLAEGSFAFKSRMFTYARERFAAIEQKELTDLDRMRLAFQLSREYFRTEQWDELAQELEHIDLGSEKVSSGKPRFHPEVEFMRAEHAMQAGDLEAAVKYLDRVPNTSVFKMYGLFNLGSAQREAGAVEAAQVNFSTVASLKAKNAEMLDLQQRATLAQAYLQRETGGIKNAERLLGRLPAEGRYRDLALASFGSLAMEQGDYELAARVWLSLQKESIWTPSTATAQLGFPLSLENMARQDLALTHYRAAEQKFSARATKLEELAVQAENPAWVRELLETFAGETVDSEQMNEWQERLGHTDWLQWLSSESVDSLLGQWRELHATQRWLEELPENFANLDLISAEQNRRAGAIRRKLVDEDLLVQQAEIESRGVAKRQQWHELSQRPVQPSFSWMGSFSTPAERERLDRLEKMYQFVQEQAAAERFDPPTVSLWLQRLERLRGLIFWQLAEERPIRLQEMHRSIRAVEKLNQELLAQADRMQPAQDKPPINGLPEAGQLQARSQQLAAKVQGALQRREQAIAQALRRGMQRESEQVEEYLLTARVAIARALDHYASIDAQVPR